MALRGTGVSADAFFFSLAAAPDASLAELLLRFTEGSAFAEHAARALRAFSEEWGVLVGRLGGDELTLVIAPEGGDGRPEAVRLERLLNRDAPAFWGSGDVLELDFEAAKALQGGGGSGEAVPAAPGEGAAALRRDIGVGRGRGRGLVAGSGFGRRRCLARLRVRSVRGS